jgi:hypothetical protein
MCCMYILYCILSVPYLMIAILYIYYFEIKKKKHLNVKILPGAKAAMNILRTS